LDKILKFFDADPGFGMEKLLIGNGKNTDPGFEINIPDPQLCAEVKKISF
jgi:hypothetical protein